MSNNTKMAQSLFNFNFDQNVAVTEYYYPEFSFVDFLSDIGGSLGLWLGVSVLNFGDMTSYILQTFNSLLKKK